MYIYINIFVYILHMCVRFASERNVYILISAAVKKRLILARILSFDYDSFSVCRIFSID